MRDISAKAILIIAAALGVVSAIFGFDMTKGYYDAYVFWWVVVPLALALTVAVCGFAGSLIKEYFDGREDERTLDKFERFRIKACQSRDIERVANIASKHFAGATGLEDTRRLHNLDSGMFNILVDKNTGRICGYICIIKLTKKGHRAILANDFKVSNLPKDFVHKAPRKEYEAVYVGAIVGVGREERAFMLMEFKSRMRRLKPQIVYARAATKDGLRILTKFNFEPMFGLPPEIGGLFHLQRQAYPDLWDEAAH